MSGNYLKTATILLTIAAQTIAPSASYAPIIDPRGDFIPCVAQEAQDRNLESLVDPGIMSFLSEPFNGFDNVNIQHEGWGIIALSNIAEGLANLYENHTEKRDELSGFMDRVVQIALDSKTSPYNKTIDGVADLGNHGLYLSHLNMILGLYQNVGNDKYLGLSEKISRHLAAGSLKSPEKHFGSYVDTPQRWPADQSVLLHSLYLFDQNNGTDLSSRPIEEWLDYMKENATDEETGLHYSEVTGTRTGKIPRGCALSWTVKYMAHFAPEEAGILWANYKEHYLKNLGFWAAFREWPEEIEELDDIDSGPVIFGVGTSATAFGLGAAQSMRDSETHLKLRRSIELGYHFVNYINMQPLNEVSGDLLAASVLFSSRN